MRAVGLVVFISKWAGSFLLGGIIIVLLQMVSTGNTELLGWFPILFLPGIILSVLGIALEEALRRRTTS